MPTGLELLAAHYAKPKKAKRTAEVLVEDEDDPVSNGVTEALRPSKGAFLSALDWIDRPGQVVRNVLRGDLGAAGRQATDFVGDTIDAVLPGDLIGAATKDADYVSGSELVGIDRKESPWLALAGDIGIGIATDPLTYTGLGFVAQG